MKLTKKVIDELPFPDGQQLIWDDELKNFGLRISRNKKTYIVQGRVHGKTRRVSLGEHGVITLQDARKKAKQTLSSMLSGLDPVEEKKRDNAHALTLRDIANVYLADRRELKESSRNDINKHLKTSFSTWADRPAIGITRDKVGKRFAELTDRSPAQANQAFRILRALFNFARGKYQVNDKPIFTENPVYVLSDTKVWNKVKARSGKIPVKKIGAAWNVLMSLREAQDKPTISRTLSDAVSFLLLTGCRWSEMAELTWDRVNLEDLSWFIPDPKNRNPVTFPLSEMAGKILEDRPRTGKYVFPSRVIKDDEEQHIVDARGIFEKLSESCGVRVTAHDLRRTFRAIAGECGIELWKTKLLMNHKLTGDVTITHYTETSDLRYLSAEVNLISKWIDRQSKIAAAGNVVPFPVKSGGEK